MELTIGQIVYSPVFNQLYLVLSSKDTFIHGKPHTFLFQLTKYYNEYSVQHRAFCFFSRKNRGIITDYLLKNIKRFQQLSPVSIQYELRSLLSNSSNSRPRFQYIETDTLTTLKDKDHLLFFISQLDTLHSQPEIDSITLLYDHIPLALHSFTSLPTSSPL